MSGRQIVGEVVNEVREISRIGDRHDLDCVGPSVRVVACRQPLGMVDDFPLHVQYEAEAELVAEHMQQRTGDLESVVGNTFVFPICVGHRLRAHLIDEAIKFFLFHLAAPLFGRKCGMNSAINPSVVSAQPTVADGREVASHPAESTALCTTRDHRLDDVAIRACVERDCPHAQKEAA